MATIIGICGSPKKKNSTTLFALTEAIAQCEKAGFNTKIVELAHASFGGCLDCGGCRKTLTCRQKDDFTHTILPLLDDPEIGGIVFASPVYFGGVTAQMKAFMDRCVTFRRNGFRFANKVAGALTVGRSRHGGQELAALDIVKNALVHGMVVVPDAPPTSHFGANLWSGHSEAIENDAVGLATARHLGDNVARHAAALRPDTIH